MDNVSKGTLPSGTDCSTEPKAALKVTKAEAKLDQKIRDLCTDGQVVAAGFAGDCAAATMVDDLVTCVRDSHAAAADSILADLQGPTLVGNKDAQKCRKTAETQLRKVADKRLKEAWKCRDSADKKRGEGPYQGRSRLRKRRGVTFEADFCRNTAYACGLSGNYTFMVIDPANNPGVEAPSWVYLHGGGIGYYDDQRRHAVRKVVLFDLR